MAGLPSWLSEVLAGDLLTRWLVDLILAGEGWRGPGSKEEVIECSLAIAKKP